MEPCNTTIRQLSNLESRGRWPHCLPGINSFDDEDRVVAMELVDWSLEKSGSKGKLPVLVWPIAGEAS